MRRAVIVVLDSCGVGAAPDAADYGDETADTLGHTAAAVGGLDLPNLRAAGLGNLHGDLQGMPPADHPTMAFGKLAEASAGRDSTTGHWEVAGIVTEQPFATFPQGFPDDLIGAIEEETGHRFLGNYPASGTVIIEELGAEHLRTGHPILYTSADSVFQVAAHRQVLALDELYGICRVARRHCDAYRVGRVIARPFEGETGAFRRTYERHDYSMPPHSPTVLDRAREVGLRVTGIGKIEDLFNGRGLTEAIHTEGDADGLDQTLGALEDTTPGILLTNLVDLDMLYGHREDPEGYARGLGVIDSYLPRLLEALGDQDLLVLTADHGNDPTDGSTDHTREFAPLLVWARRAAGVDLGVGDQFCDVAATVAEGLGLPAPQRGASFLGEVT
ncbi:MAG: phosphopentomutase [Acidimicrobiia bacterium]